MGCVQVELAKDHSAQNSDKVFMTSKCTVCQEWTPSIPMSADTGLGTNHRRISFNFIINYFKLYLFFQMPILW